MSISKTRSSGDLSYDFIRYERISLLENEAKNGNKTSKPMSRGSLLEDITSMKNFVDLLDSKAKHAPENEIVRCCPFTINRQHEEFHYLDLIAEILSNGFKTMDRTGSPTTVLNCNFGQSPFHPIATPFPRFRCRHLNKTGYYHEI